jgi:transcriptional regulator with XRE-family HTH domain
VREDIVDAGRIMREARRRAGLTQTEVARRAGVPQATVARIENRLRTPRVDTLDRLLATCGAALILTRRLGLDIEREPIRRLLRLSPRYRISGKTARLVWLFAARRLRFVVIGEVAERLQGSPVEPEILSLCVEPEYLNRRRLGVALRTLKMYRLRYGDLRWRWTPPPPIRSYEELRRGAVKVRIARHAVAVACLDDLIRMRLAGRSREHNAAADLLGAVREEADRWALERP